MPTSFFFFYKSEIYICVRKTLNVTSDSGIGDYIFFIHIFKVSITDMD